jgi:hypothetical protein
VFVVKRRRSYATIAEGMALLGAQVVGSNVPIAPGLTLYRALRGDGTPTQDQEFVARFLDEIERWCEAPGRRRRVLDIGGLGSGWRDRLADRLDGEAAVGRPEAVALLGDELFTPQLEAPDLRAIGDVLLD